MSSKSVFKGRYKFNVKDLSKPPKRKYSPTVIKNPYHMTIGEYENIFRSLHRMYKNGQKDIKKYGWTMGMKIRL